MPQPESVSKEVRRIAATLRTAIKLSNVSHRNIERTLGMSTGYLTRILSGQVSLKASHVLGVCHVIGFPLADFFAALYPPSLEETADALARGLAQLHSEPSQSRDLRSVIQEVRGSLDQIEALLERGRKP